MDRTRDPKRVGGEGEDGERTEIRQSNSEGRREKERREERDRIKIKS